MHGDIGSTVSMERSPQVSIPMEGSPQVSISPCIPGHCTYGRKQVSISPCIPGHCTYGRKQVSISPCIPGHCTYGRKGHLKCLYLHAYQGTVPMEGRVTSSVYIYTHTGIYILKGHLKCVYLYTYWYIHT